MPIEPFGASISRMLVTISDVFPSAPTIPLEVLDRMLPFVLMMTVLPIGLLIVPPNTRSCALLSKRLFWSMFISVGETVYLMLNKRLTVPASSSTCGLAVLLATLMFWMISGYGELLMIVTMLKVWLNVKVGVV